jgi:hypothetical protein
MSADALTVCMALNEINYLKYLYFWFMGNIKLFESKQIRTVWNEPDQKRYFVVADVV